MYTNTDYNIHGAIPLLFPFCSPFESPLLTWNPPRCDRIRPPRSQVAGKLIFPFPSPCSYTSPFQNPDPPEFPRSKYTFIRTTSRIWLTRSRTLPSRCRLYLLLQLSALDTTQGSTIFFSCFYIDEGAGCPSLLPPFGHQEYSLLRSSMLKLLLFGLSSSGSREWPRSPSSLQRELQLPPWPRPSS